VLRSIKYGIYGAVLAGLVAAPAVWASTTDKSVDLIVDGHAHSVRTSADHVGTVVKQAGFRVTSHDLLAPSASSPVREGQHIVLRRGRLLHLSVDDRKVAVWTTAPTVSAALAQLGYSTSDFVSVSRSQRLPLGATNIAIRTPRSVVVVHDGKRERVTTTAPTVSDLLGSLNITVGVYDRLSTSLNSALATGQTVVVQRVKNRYNTRTVAVPYPTTKKKVASLFTGETKVLHGGRKGSARQTFLLVYVDGKLTAKSLVGEQSLRDARAQVVAVGTKRVVGNGPTAAQALARMLLAKRGWSNQYSCLVAMWNRESHWNIHAANPSGAYGIPQALPGSKMSSAGPDWQNNAETQIKWGLNYIAARYHTPCEAWGLWQQQGWY
jgi:uncharacterized protein YabE (DUF348 family)